MSNKLSGLRVLGYQGTNARNPPQTFYQKRNPTSQDAKNYSLGDLWLNRATRQVWTLVSLAGYRGSPTPLVAVWIQIAAGNVGMESLAGNNSLAVFGNGASTINLIGDGTYVKVVGNQSTHTLTMSVVENSVLLNLEGDTGGMVGSSGGNIDLLGTSGHVTTSGSGNTITIDTSDIFTSTFATDSGSAIPAGNVLNFLGQNNIVTTGAGSTITVALSSSPSLTNLTVQNLTVTNSETFSNLPQGVVQSSSSGVISSSERHQRTSSHIILYRYPNMGQSNRWEQYCYNELQQRDNYI